MQDEVLAKALSTDSEVVPRYNIIGADGVLVAENARMELVNEVLDEGTKLNKANLLDDEAAAMLANVETVNEALKYLRVSNLDFAAISWEDFELVCNLGFATFVFSIGDTRTEILSTGEQVEFRIEDFFHDEMSDGSGYATATISMTGCLQSAYAMNTTATNSGGWGSSDMRSRMSTFKSQLPTDLQGILKTVKKLTAVENWALETVETDDTLWLYSITEAGLGKQTVTDDEGAPYPLFIDNSSRIKKVNGTAVNWWLRSPDESGNDDFLNIKTDGGRINTDANTPYYVCFGFCI